MSDNLDKPSPGEAREALDSVAKMESAGWRRAVPDRWFGAVISLLIASIFALYALPNPHQYISFPIVALALIIPLTREKRGAYGRDFPSKKTNKWALPLFIAFLLIVFFGSIFIRRAYDAAWVPLLAGLMVGLIVFFASENERRAYLKKTGQGENK